MNNKFNKRIASGILIFLLTVKVLVPTIALAEEVTTTEAPAAPQTAEAPQTASAPSTASSPQSPSTPDSPDSPKTPGSPDLPSKPGDPKTPEYPSEPKEPRERRSRDYDSYGGNTQNSPTQNQTQSEGAGSSSNGNVGDTAITTGNGNNDATLITTGNSNTSANGGCCGGGASVSNSGNGSGSDNSASASTNNGNTTNQTNSATVGNNLNQATVTGDNSSSYNVGNSSITTGNANTTGTIITAVNTNVDGVAVSEFNIADDHNGDIVLDFNAACTQGCAGPVVANNSNNGVGSDNTANSTNNTNNSTDQNNIAHVDNNLVLEANSGDNTSSYNTGGDSSITTGDANVNANVLTFANNNFAGNVIYGVVNIFGDLVGDIILTEEAMNAACGGSCAGPTTAANTGNGDYSDNTANSSNTTNTDIFQSNDATINNNLVFNAVTGDNNTGYNTGGNNSIETGSADVTANILNIANSNIIGGNWWLVIVNEGGQWIGKIMGSPDGSNMAGSAGTEFVVDPITGAVTAKNSGNGVGSDNNTTANNTTSNSINQTNTAVVNNNIDLTANTGGNKANYNTGGDSNIVTGDAKIVANLVNFVNNNVVGGGKLVVTVINVFGSWLGDFVAPGQTQQAKTQNNNSNTTSNNGSSSNNSSGGSSTVASAKGQANVTVAGSTVANNNDSSFAGSVKGSNTNGTTLHEATVAKSVGQDGSAAVADKKLRINLAWLLLALPLAGVAFLAKRSFVPVQKLAIRGIHLFL